MSIHVHMWLLECYISIHLLTEADQSSLRNGIKYWRYYSKDDVHLNHLVHVMVGEETRSCCHSRQGGLVTKRWTANLRQLLRLQQLQLQQQWELFRVRVCRWERRQAEQEKVCFTSWLFLLLFSRTLCRTCMIHE